MRDMTAIELKAHLEAADPAPLLLDVREPWEYDKAHLPDARLVPMRQIPDSIDRFEPDSEIVVYCHMGVRSRSVAMYLEQNNFSNVINLRGGIDGWSREVDTSVPVY